MSKLLIVEDSDITRNELKIIAIESGLFDQVLTASNGEEGIKQVIKGEPDACILDLEMPRMGGFTFLKWVMKNKPIPVIIFSSLYSDENIFKALELGAIDFLGKNENYITGNFKEKVIDKLKILKHSRPGKMKVSNPDESVPEEKKEKSIHSKYKLIVLGASTGGPTAIQKILKDIDGKISVPIIVCQHMPKNFTPLFAERLNKMILNYTVKEAKDGDLIENNAIFICPGESHTIVNGKKLNIVPSKKSDLYSPSINMALETSATSYRENIIGIILTGMGKDGIMGAKKVKELGGMILVQSLDSCVIGGMPGEIIKNNLYDLIVPIENLGEKIVEICNEK